MNVECNDSDFVVSQEQLGTSAFAVFFFFFLLLALKIELNLFSQSCKVNSYGIFTVMPFTYGGEKYSKQLTRVINSS